MPRSTNDPKTLSAAIVTQGAILTLENALQVLVGYWEWLDDHRIFYFEAGGHDEFAGHILSFDHAIALNALGVEFRGGAGQLLAYLAPIAAVMEDITPYQAAWHDWLSESRSLVPNIEQLKTQLAATA